MHESIPTLPNTPSWRGVQLNAQGQFYLLKQKYCKMGKRRNAHKILVGRPKAKRPSEDLGVDANGS
jgi:hypothetical protein